MNIVDLYENELCENEKRDVINRIISFIKSDGFNVDMFSLVSIEHYVWEFISNSDTNRGFLIFYNPRVVNTPIPQYQLFNGCVYYSFDARNITEAYIQHNKSISNEDYMLLSKEYAPVESNIKNHIKEVASKYGYEAACDIFNCTEEWLQS